MNRDEVKKILEIIAKADGGCIYCVTELFNRFVHEFPEFTDIAMETFKKNFNEELGDVEKRAFDHGKTL